MKRLGPISGCFLLLLVGCSPVALPAAEPVKTASDTDWNALPWSFQPIHKPAVPTIANPAWAKDDLDRFVAARRDKFGLRPNPDADRQTLIRRLSFDLTGLPPTQKEIAALVDDPASDDEALARAVDRYLKSPHFGERWGRHWLDLVRYGDSTSRAWNAPLTYAFRYRDWVIDALNGDKPYDRFLTEQLAGDLLPADTDEQARSQHIATGFLALGAADVQNLSHEQFLMDVIDDQIDVTSRAVLALSISCARCHDHKYDPVTMRDYYALAGVFSSMRTLPGVAHRAEHTGAGYVDPEKLIVLPGFEGERLPPGVHSMSDYQAEWSTGQRDIRFATAAHLAMGVEAVSPRDCEIRLRGEPYDKGDAPPRGDWRIPGLPRPPRVAASSGGRLELAQWLTSPENPLTARVLANRVWQHLFGEGLVRTVDDFGLNSEPPTDPLLLDHLATRLREDGWSLKKLIRIIVLSRTYRQSSATQLAAHERDPDNAYYWRMNLRRLEIEPLRDSLLDLSGRLSLDRPEGIQIAGIGGKSKQSQVRGLLTFSSAYRTVYLPVVRAGLPEEFGTFDFPDPCLLAGRREVTTVAPQALFFLNGDFVTDCSQGAAERLLEYAPEDDAGRVDWAYRRAFARPATPAEVVAAIKLVRGLQPDASERDPGHYRWSTFLQALMASAEFRYVR
ncbi:MAG: DUF1549 and DUF1553 domain-containing protein [Pirellulaceae bacterium]|nr:DUF1549 and DUF1553 domain-containing protein [Pirellulaceae bacterium]